jgi:hypothetical protein
MNAQRFQPFLERVRLASQQFPGLPQCECDKLKWPSASIEATNNFDYGNLFLKTTAQAFSVRGKNNQEHPSPFLEDEGHSQAKFLP